MIFKIFQIRNNIKEAKENPGGFAGSQLRDLVVGTIILPLIFIILGLAFLFMLAFTNFLGGPYLFFKIIFFVGLLGSYFIGLVIYKLTKALSRTTKKVVNKTVENIRTVEFKEKE